MDVTEAIKTRRAYRSLAPVEITDELIHDLATHASLAASCFNNQPWRYLFIRDAALLATMRDVFSKGNEWCYAASMIVVVLSKEDLDCVIHERKYYLFAVGMATAHIILRATELGLVAHPIAGYSPKKCRAILGIPENYEVVTLVLVGKHADTLNPVLSADQVRDEGERPARKSFDEFAFIDRLPDGGLT